VRRASVEFRGERVDVEFRLIEDDPTTNSLVIDWGFVDKDIERFAELTPEEEEAIHDDLAERDRYDVDLDED
jgi:hypothetical protein